VGFVEKLDESVSVSSEDVSDTDLIQVVRVGDDAAASEASGHLFRRHYAPALSFATWLAGESLAADLVADCFEKTFAQLRRGQGPDSAFRAYLLTAVRRTHVDYLRRGKREVAVDDAAYIADASTTRAAIHTGDGAEARFDAETIRRAFRSLPERWQAILWHTTVENEPVRQVAERLGMNSNSVAASAFVRGKGYGRPSLQNTWRTQKTRLAGLR